jgi:hypothetical protein
MDGTPISLLRPDIKEYNIRNKIQNNNEHFVQNNTETINSNTEKSYDSNHIDPDMKKMLKQPLNSETKKQIKINPTQQTKIKINTNSNTNTNTNTNTENESETDTETETETQLKPLKVKKQKRSFLQKMSQYLIDPIILLVIYVLMSQDFAKHLIGKYVQVINPDENGLIGIKGILAYGLVLVLLYNITRLIVHKIKN